MSRKKIKPRLMQFWSLLANPKANSERIKWFLHKLMYQKTKFNKIYRNTKISSIQQDKMYNTWHSMINFQVCRQEMDTDIIISSKVIQAAI